VSPIGVNFTFLSGMAKGSRPLPGIGVSPNTVQIRRKGEEKDSEAVLMAE
jgi:hypothetical protein